MSVTLAEQQAALLAALAGDAPVPAGFDATRVNAAAQALAFKRARSVVQAWPGLRALVGASLRDRFAAFAANHAQPAHGGPLADGRKFVRALAREIELSDAVTLQALEVDVRFRDGGTGLIARRWPTLRAAWLRERRCVALVLAQRRYFFRLGW